MNVKEGDIVLCTVKKIENTTVFLELEDKTPATMVLSEVAAGRIRNLREFITPNKKIVCKVLRKIDGNPEMSLRRVTAKERTEVMDSYKKEKNLGALLRPVLKDKTEAALEKIAKDHELSEFFDMVKKDAKLIEKYVSKDEAQKLVESISEKKDKEKEVKKTILVKSNSPDGLLRIRNALAQKDVEISYLGSSKFLVRIKDTDFKKANARLDAAIAQLTEKAKAQQLIFEVE